MQSLIFRLDTDLLGGVGGCLFLVRGDQGAVEPMLGAHCLNYAKFKARDTALLGSASTYPTIGFRD